MRATIRLPHESGVEAFLPPFVFSHLRPGCSVQRFGTTDADFDAACRLGARNDLAILEGSYDTLVQDAFRDLPSTERRLQTMARTPGGVALLFSEDLPVGLDASPRVPGADQLYCIPPEWYHRHYLLPVAGFADLQLRWLHATKGMPIPLLGKIKVHFGVFVPDRSLVRAFGVVVSDLRRHGIDDFSHKVVCDTFAGSGVFGLLAARFGARVVHFVDKDPQAIHCVAENVSRLQPVFRAGMHPAFRASLHVTDVFPEEATFDTVIANPPWKSSGVPAPRSHQHRDPGRQILQRFFQQLRRRLRPGGAAYLFYELAGRADIRRLSWGFSVEEYPVPAAGPPRLLFRLRPLTPSSRERETHDDPGEKLLH